MSDDNPTWGCCPRTADEPMPPNRACKLTYSLRRVITRYIRRFEDKFVPEEWAEVAWYDESEEEEEKKPYSPLKKIKIPPEVGFCLVRGKDKRTFGVRFVLSKRVKVRCVYSLFPVF